MSRSLLLECDPVDHPAALDAVERASWCAMRVWAGGQCVSTSRDRSSQAERKTLYVPAFPVAEWLARNWWALLNEVCSWDTVPVSPGKEAQKRWKSRHCLRSADSSLMLPALYLFHDGKCLRAEWRSDAPGSLPHMPGEFTAEGTQQLDRNTTEDALADFVNGVLDRVAGTDDEAVRQLRALWRAIQGADTEEKRFCTLAGRMGLDPYDPSEVSDELARFFEESISDVEAPLVRDLTEVARPESIASQWSWLTKANSDLGLRANPVDLPFDLPSLELPPPQFGYRLARQVRSAADTAPAAPLHSVTETAKSVLRGGFRTEDYNHIPGQGIRAIVGGSESGDIVVAGPRPSRVDSQRFLEARSLYHALAATRKSQRLVTEAGSWDQKASRAFAAELLAPRQALLNRLTESAADGETVDRLSSEFQASTLVIERQLENTGIPLSLE